MSKLSLKKSLMILVTGSLSLVMFIESVAEYNVYSLDKSIDTERRSSSSSSIVERSIKPNRIQYLPLNHQNILAIDGRWMITHMTHKNNEIIYDKDRSQEKTLAIDVRLIRTSVVTIDDNDEMIFHISSLNNSREMVLFREKNGYFEFIKARKIMFQEKVKAKKMEEVVAAKKENILVQKSEKRRFKNGDFILGKAIGPLNFKNLRSAPHIFRGEEQAQGYLSLHNDNVKSLTILLQKKNDEPLFELDINSAQINNGGQFTTYDSVNDQIISGIILKHAKKEFKIKIATGKLQGATLYFVHENDLNLLRESNEKYKIQREQGRARQEKALALRRAASFKLN